MRALRIQTIMWVTVLLAQAFACSDDDDGDPTNGAGGTAGADNKAGNDAAVATGGTFVSTGGSGGEGSTEIGASGFPESKRIVELTADEVAAFCEWVDSMPGSGVEQDCGGGLTVTVGSSEDCLNATSDVSSDCQVTVAQSETCFIDMLADPCSGVIVPPSCMVLFGCATW